MHIDTNNLSEHDTGTLETAKDQIVTELEARNEGFNPVRYSADELCAAAVANLVILASGCPDDGEEPIDPATRFAAVKYLVENAKDLATKTAK